MHVLTILHQRIIAFVRNRHASLPLMAAFLLVPMTIAAGGALDFIQHERIRLALQDALDRGTLAAASLKQTENAELLIKSYLKTVPSGGSAVVTVDDQHQVNLRKVTAHASIVYTTSFLRLAGVDTLSVNANSAAQEARSNIELSMVLDISGSMYDNGGMVQLRPAAKQFLDIVLKDDVKAVTSVSVIPFAGTVNLGYDVFNYLTGYIALDTSASAKAAALSTGTCSPSAASTYARKHCYTSCLDAIPADFGAGKPSFAARPQLSHFTYYNYNTTGKKPWWCPTEDASITYLTNDIDYLKARVDALQPFDGTGTAFGMKWAELLLNPSMQPTVSALSSNNIVPIPAAFRARPSAFNDPSTLKFIVLMTDGQIGFQPRPTSASNPAYAGKNISASGQNSVLYTESQSVGYYKDVCAAVKKEGITVFTIAFKVSSSIAATIATCASDPSYAYKVDGLDMASAFQSIATTMQKLRLVQ